MSFWDYKYYECPQCKNYLTSHGDQFVCMECCYWHPRERERELIDAHNGKPLEFNGWDAQRLKDDPAWDGSRVNGIRLKELRGLS